MDNDGEDSPLRVQRVTETVRQSEPSVTRLLAPGSSASRLFQVSVENVLKHGLFLLWLL